MVFAHGIGGAKDLPIPAEYAMAGAGAALAVSFIVLALAWRTPRFDAATHGRPVPAWLAAVGRQHRASRWCCGCSASRSSRTSSWAAVAGPGPADQPDVRRGLRAAVGRHGADVAAVRAVLPGGQPAAHDPPAVHPADRRPPRGRAADAAAAGSATGPPRSACSPSCGSSWSTPGSTYLSPVRLWFAAYIAIVIVGGALFGSEWLERADPFEVYSTLVGHLSVFGRTADGTLVLRSPLGNLDGVRGPARAGRRGRGAVRQHGLRQLQGLQRVAASSPSRSPSARPWLDLVRPAAVLPGRRRHLRGRDDGHRGASTGSPAATLPDLFAHSVVPIIVGYIVAHYLQLLRRGRPADRRAAQRPARRAAANLLGTADLAGQLLAHPRTRRSWRCSRCSSVVTGHVLGVIAAHDRAIKLLPRRHQLTGQLPLLFVMVFYTVTGLYLLFGA